MTTMCWMRSRPACCTVDAAHPATSATVVHCNKRFVTRARVMLAPGKIVIVRRHATSLPSWVRARQCNVRAHRAGALMPRRDGHCGTRLGAHDPLDLQPVVGHVVIGPERHAGVLVGLAFELADIVAQLAGRK